MFNRVEVFSATMARERATLGDRVTEWLRGHPNVEIVDAVVRQSSDYEYHCLTIVLFGKEDYKNDRNQRRRRRAG
jgi:hypothetical protein